MVKTYKAVLSLVCCLLLGTAFSLPVAAQSTAPQSTTPPSSDVNQDRNLNTPSTPSDQYNSSQPSDMDREKPADPGVQDRNTSGQSDTQTQTDRTTTTERSRTTTSSDNQSDSDRDLPRTATGMPLVGLIGAASLTAAAIRRRYF